jgi:hypothetical protein
MRKRISSSLMEEDATDSDTGVGLLALSCSVLTILPFLAEAVVKSAPQVAH